METSAHWFDTISLLLFIANDKKTVSDSLSIIVTIYIPGIIFTEQIIHYFFLLNHRMISFCKIPGRVHGIYNYSIKLNCQRLTLRY